MTAEELGRKVSERVDEFGDYLVLRADLEALGLRHNSLVASGRIDADSPARPPMGLFNRL